MESQNTIIDSPANDDNITLRPNHDNANSPQIMAVGRSASTHFSSVSMDRSDGTESTRDKRKGMTIKTSRQSAIPSMRSLAARS